MSMNSYICNRYKMEYPYITSTIEEINLHIGPITMYDFYDIKDRTDIPIIKNLHDKLQGVTRNPYIDDSDNEDAYYTTREVYIKMVEEAIGYRELILITDNGRYNMGIPDPEYLYLAFIILDIPNYLYKYECHEVEDILDEQYRLIKDN